MAELLAHLLLLGRHHRTVVVGGRFRAYCLHISPSGRQCWQWASLDGYCSGHNATCYTYCDNSCT